MSELEMNPLFLGMRKSVGGFVLYNRKGKTIVRLKGKKTKSPSEAQLEINNTFSRLTSFWEPMQGILQNSWYAAGIKKDMNGYNLFVKENFGKERNGFPIVLAKNFGDIDPPVISALPGNAGEISVSYQVTPAETDRQIHLFLKRKLDGLSNGDLTRYSVNRDDNSPFTVSGLEPDGEYYIYAVLTDWEYKTATQVSASVCVVAKAGV